jgi:stearoyl-CoA desaturase (delta-9 desaturase)
MNEFFYTLIVTHITIICVTVFLHRGQAHRGLEFHPVLSHAMRFWLWMTTAMSTKEWVAVHRKHHRYDDQEGDPHSPHVFGFLTVLFKGAGLYHQAAKDRAMVNTYGAGTPDDWMEKNIYTAFPLAGVIVMLIIDYCLFGAWGLLIWGIQMIWIPFWAAGVINGVGHWIGYRNGETKDHSRNISPWGIIIGGECLHNNHHLDPANPKLSRRWFEFDIGWMWIQIFKYCKLLTVKNTP